ncbi:MAG: hypothetical protein ABEJ82_00715 [Haloplanus sp.]
MALLWYLDRASGLLAYATLYVAVLTGVFYTGEEFGALTRLARRYHVRLALLSTLLFLFHAVVGFADAGLVVTGRVPAPRYPTWYFVVGTAVGGEALLLLVVAVLGFLDARRFDRPWTPRVVHALAYGGYAFATVHLFAIGSDVDATARLLVLVSLAGLAYALLLRLLAEVGALRVGATESS